MSLQSLQQLTGANYFFYYGATIFKSVGIKDSFVTQIILGAVNFVCTFGGLYVMERVGLNLSCCLKTPPTYPVVRSPQASHNRRNLAVSLVVYLRIGWDCQSSRSKPQHREVDDRLCLHVHSRICHDLGSVCSFYSGFGSSHRIL